MVSTVRKNLSAGMLGWLGWETSKALETQWTVVQKAMVSLDRAPKGDGYLLGGRSSQIGYPTKLMFGIVCITFCASEISIFKRRRSH